MNPTTFPPNSLDLAFDGRLKSAPDGWETDPKGFLVARAKGLADLAESLLAGLKKRDDVPALLRNLALFRKEHFVFDTAYSFKKADRPPKGASRPLSDFDHWTTVSLGEPIKGISTDPGPVPPIDAGNVEILDFLTGACEKIVALWVPWMRAVAAGEIVPVRYVDTFVGLERPFPRSSLSKEAVS